MEPAEQLIQSSDLVLPVSKQTLIAALLPRVGFTSYPWLARGLPLGNSRFGGPADLPVGVDWPAVDGRPLMLLTQLNFADLPIDRRHPSVKQLPARGWFCLFVDPIAQGMANGDAGVVAMQFDGDAAALIRHDSKPASDAQVWTQCHAATVYPADHHLCLPDAEAVDSPLLGHDMEAQRGAYDALRSAIDDLARTRHEVRLLGSPTLLNPDRRLALPDPTEWMLLLEFDGDCRWLAGVQNPDLRYLRRPCLEGADFVQYFVRKSDYAASRLNRGYFDCMMT